MFTILLAVIAFTLGTAIGYFLGNSKGVTNTISNTAEDVKNTIDTIKK